MGINRLQKLKKITEKEIKITEVEKLVIGGDQLSFYLLSKLSNDVQIMIPNIDQTFSMGPSAIRGEENLSRFQSLFTELDLEEMKEIPAFFRDQRFREFGGRSKPEKLLGGEDFFTKVSKSFDWDKISVEVPSDYFELIPSEVKFIDDRWEISCTNGEKIICKTLFWARDPSELGRLMEKDDAVQNFCQHIQPLCTLHINYRYDHKVKAPTRTFFIPASYTYDWGHFIGELKDDGERFEFIYLFDKTDISEDELTKRIKIIKRSIEKIFPEVATFSVEEELIVRDYSGVYGIDDDLYTSMPGLFLTGINSPVKEKNKELSHWARAFQSIEEVLSQQT